MFLWVWIMPSEKITQKFTKQKKMNMEHKSFDDLIESVTVWASVKGLIKEENAKSQMIKVLEEVGETGGALLKGNREEVIDGIGDSFVTLIILARQLGLNPKDCLESAYNEIANRKGQMVDGSFVKEESK